MLRLLFSVDDLARLTFRPPFRLCEVAGSVEAIQHPASAFRKRWQAASIGLPDGARSLLDVIPARGGVPEFLAPERDGSLGELVEVVRATPTHRIAAELAGTSHAGSRSRWVGHLRTGSPRAVDDLGHAIQSWHNQVVAPLWPSIRPLVDRELSHRAWQLASRGAAATLNSLDPRIRWHDGVLEIDAPVHADVVLGGRGLRLVPSAIWSRPVLALGWEKPSLTYPIIDDGWPRSPSGSAGQTHRLGPVIGSTRVRVLRKLALGHHSTSELASALGISLAAASTQAATLREAGLVATNRDGRAVRHELTELGERLMSSAKQPR